MSSLSLKALQARKLPTMNTNITRKKSPEDTELEKKKGELAVLEGELVRRELELVTLHAELRTFEGEYLRIVGCRYAEFDEIEADIAEAQAKLNPRDSRAQEAATQARAQAEETGKTVGADHEETKPNGFKPSASLKNLYREVAKQIHPDLATDERERARRQVLMAAANRAYEECDEANLRRILEEWESSPESVRGEGTAAELIRIIRKIAQVITRVSAINSELARLRESDLFNLKVKYDEAQNDGRDLFAEMASRVEVEIQNSRKRLELVLKEGRNE